MQTFSPEHPYFFPSGKFYVKLRTAVVAGVGRSGKTTLGNLLATNHNIEYADEPWLLHTLPIMSKLKLIDARIGREMFLTSLSELANDTVLMRQANFRPGDLSTIWTKKTSKEIFSRLVSLRTRADVKKFIKKNKPLFLLALSGDPAFSLPVILDFLPGSKMIYMVRRGIDVAHDVKAKKWFSDRQLVHPPHAQLFRSVMYKGKRFYVPCWVASADEKEFLSYSEYERGLFYWCTLVEYAIKELERPKTKKHCLMVKYEELIEDPQRIAKKVNSFLNSKPSPLTKTALRNIRQYQKVYKKTPKVSPALLARTKALYKHLKYEWY